MANTPLSSTYWSDNHLVLTERQRDRIVRDGSEDPRFSDGLWLTAALNRLPNTDRNLHRINFDHLFPDRVHHLTARELVMQLLHRPVRKYGKRKHTKSIATILQIISDLKMLYKSMSDSGLTRLSQIDRNFIGIYINNLANSGVSTSTQRGRLSVLNLLYEARNLLSVDRIEIEPFPGVGLDKVVGSAASQENLTPRIPEEVIEPLLKWCILYVNDFSDDIIAANSLNEISRPTHSLALDELPGLKRIASRMGAAGAAVAVARRRMSTERLLKAPTLDPDDGDAALGELPDLNGLPAYGIHLSRQAAHEVASEADHLGFDIRKVGLVPGRLGVSGKPWRPPLEGGYDIMLESRLLITACYIICAYLSGMRDSEVQAMKIGCIRHLRDEEGDIIRRYAESREFKGKTEGGKKRTWVVIEQFENAVNVVTRLCALQRLQMKTDYLFIRAHRSRPEERPTLKRRINLDIASLVRHVNEVLEPWHGSPALPRIPIESFQPIATRMFRRTIAWFIAHRPFGTVAGAIQFGHLSTHIFEGYAGTSASGFRQEVEAERKLAQTSDFLEVYEQHKDGRRLAGPGGDELDNELSYLITKLGDFPGRIIDRQQRDRMVEHLSKKFYPGELADCLFDPDEAKCRADLDEIGVREPLRGNCDPYCGNACWREKHLPVWKAAIDDLNRLSKSNGASVAQREILRLKRKEYQDIIKAITERNCAAAT